MKLYPDGEHRATNGVGWEVQWLTTRGWIGISKVYQIKKEAGEECLSYSSLWTDEEYRVYEVLE